MEKYCSPRKECCNDKNICLSFIWKKEYENSRIENIDVFKRLLQVFDTTKIIIVVPPLLLKVIKKNEEKWIDL